MQQQQSFEHHHDSLKNRLWDCTMSARSFNTLYRTYVRTGTYGGACKLYVVCSTAPPPLASTKLALVPCSEKSPSLFPSPQFVHTNTTCHVQSRGRNAAQGWMVLRGSITHRFERVDKFERWRWKRKNSATPRKLNPATLDRTACPPAVGPAGRLAGRPVGHAAGRPTHPQTIGRASLPGAARDFSTSKLT